jgi:hypothetical protein
VAMRCRSLKSNADVLSDIPGMGSRRSGRMLWPRTGHPTLSRRTMLHAGAANSMRDPRSLQQ